MCAVLLPPGVNPIAVNRYIKCRIIPKILITCFYEAKGWHRKDIPKRRVSFLQYYTAS